MSEPKRFEELFCSVHVWKFFRKGMGGLPYSKLFEELLCLSLEIFQKEGGGYLIPKTQGGGSRPFGKIPNRSRFFLRMASLSS